MRATRGRILVIRGGAIGDFILTLPTIAALRRQFPEAHLEVLGYPHIAQLALAGGLVDRVQPIDARGLAGFYAAGGALDQEVANYFARFDIVVSYLFDPDLIFQTNVARCTRAQFIQGPHRPNEAEPVHATLVYLRPLDRLAIFEADPVPKLNLTRIASHAAPFLALHPGSDSDGKNWPEPNWAALLQRLLARTREKLFLVGGAAEGARLEQMAKSLPPERVELARNLPLAELAARLQNCAAFVGHDSGISHLAAALGLPTLALWGDTNEEIWRPRGERVVVLRDEAGLCGLTVDRVVREIEPFLVSQTS
jgi:heptosyltransferase III